MEPELVRHRALLDGMARMELPYPAGRFAGRGMVICGGGTKYFPCVYVLVRLLRHLGCAQPIEVWHLGAREMSPGMRGLLAAHGAVCVDALEVRRVHPARRLGGWELKCYALLHSRFDEVLLLDADNCPVRDPAFLFDSPQYRRHGAVFWPDFWRFRRDAAVWVAAGIPPRKAREAMQFESGQILIHKARCWRALHVAMHLNEHSDWWYRLVHGDKDTFFLAWEKIGQRHAMVPHPVRPLDGVMLQHDFDGRLLFQHRNFAKWTLEDNRRIPGFRMEERCLMFLAELRAQWQPGLPPWVRKWEPSKAAKPLHAVAARLCRAPLYYIRAGLGHRPMEFRPDGTIGTGAAACERWWDLRLVKPVAGGVRKVQLEVFGQQGLTFRARPARGGWRGAWVAFERSAVFLRPIRKAPKSAAKAPEGIREMKNGEKGRKKPFGHVPKCSRSGSEAPRDVKKRSRSGSEALRDVKKRSRSGSEALWDVRKRSRSGSETLRDMENRVQSGSEALRDMGKRDQSGSEALRDVRKRSQSRSEAVGDVPKRLLTPQNTVREVPKRPRNGREPVRNPPGRRRNAGQPLSSHTL
jgi:hypothetical protein